MRLLKRLSAPVGAVVLLASLSTNLILPERSTLVAVLLGAGLFLVLLGLLLNLKEIVSRARGRAAREGGADLAYIIIVAVTLCLANLLAARHHKRIDLTEQGTFSLSEQTRRILASLPREVEARAYYYSGTLAAQKMKDLLDEYAYQAPQRFHVTFVDPVKNPGQAKSDGITQEQSVFLRSGPQSTLVNAPDEEGITNAVLKVTKDVVQTVCFALGHGEKDPKESGPQGYSSFQAAVEKQQSKVETFSPASGVPATCAAVVVAGPEKPWAPEETAKLQEYLDRGGKAAILVDPGQNSGLEPLLGRFGITLRHDWIIDRVSALFGGKPDIPMVPGDGYESHPITKGFRFQTFYPLATSLVLASPSPAGVTLQPLARTTPLSWGEMDYEKEAQTGKLKMDPKDQPGPLVLAAVATKKAEGKQPASSPASRPPSGPESRLVVFGDSDFASNSFFNATSNGEMLLNVSNWLVGQEELIAIRPKSRLPSLVTLTQRQASLIWLVSILIAPATIVVAGTIIWVRRRKL
jgi:ABC-type uncharacterized transport system involved in gliding motility auxiliary subunit